METPTYVTDFGDIDLRAIEALEVIMKAILDRPSRLASVQLTKKMAENQVQIEASIIVALEITGVNLRLTNFFRPKILFTLSRIEGSWEFDFRLVSVFEFLGPDDKGFTVTIPESGALEMPPDFILKLRQMVI